MEVEVKKEHMALIKKTMEHKIKISMLGPAHLKIKVDMEKKVMKDRNKNIMGTHNIMENLVKLVTLKEVDLENNLEVLNIMDKVVMKIGHRVEAHVMDLVLIPEEVQDAII